MDPIPPTALEGVRIVELGSGIPTAFAARLLGDLGAEVVKIEPPGGDPLRAAEPRTADGTSLLFELCNWGKRSVCDPPAHGAALLAGADAVIAPPDALPAPPAELLAAHPALIVTTVAGFGARGPWSGWAATDLILQATGGIMQISGTSDREPLKHGLQQSLWCGGLNAAYATLAAHLGGGGVHVDLSLQECIASELVLNEAHYAFMGAVQGRRPPGGDPLAGEPLPAADGLVSLQTSGLITAKRLADLFGDPRLEEPRFASTESRTHHAAELQAILAEHLAHESARDFFLRASGEGYLSGFVQTPSELLECPQLQARGVWHAFDDLPGVRFPAAIASMSATPQRVRGRAPALGGDAPEWEPRARRPRREAPLAGVRVVDLSTVFAVPYLAALMADLGAEVIKVEAPHRLDQTRALFGHPFVDNTPTGDWWDRSGAFQVVNRGKRSLTLDLAQPEGREVLHELLAQADVLVDNFTPRVLRGWGMTADVLHARYPDLITLSNTGYGSTGPWAAFRAQGTSLEATMGISHLTGYPDGRPAKVGQSYPDFVACWSGLVALLAALVHRERTGEGQHIDLGMYQLGVVVMPEAVLHLQAHGEELSRRGNEDLGAFAGGLVPAAGEDRWLAVSFPSAEAFTRMFGPPAPGEEPMARVAAWARGRDAADAAAALQAAGVPAGPGARRPRPADQRASARARLLRARGRRRRLRTAPGHRPAVPARRRARPRAGPGVRGGQRRRPARPARLRRGADGRAAGARRHRRRPDGRADVARADRPRGAARDPQRHPCGRELPRGAVGLIAVPSQVVDERGQELLLAARELRVAEAHPGHHLRDLREHPRHELDRQQREREHLGVEAAVDLPARLRFLDLAAALAPRAAPLLLAQDVLVPALERLPAEQPRPARGHRPPRVRRPAPDALHERRGRVVGVGVELLVDPRPDAPDDLVVEADLVAEVVVDELLVRPRGAGDRIDARSGQALGGELARGRLQQLLATPSVSAPASCGRVRGALGAGLVHATMLADRQAPPASTRWLTTIAPTMEENLA